MLVYVAYVDDSRQTDPPIYVLGGYLSTAKDWAAFSNEWAEALAEIPALEYFKMSEANARLGEFAGAYPEVVNYRVSRLYAIIEKYVIAEFSVMLQPDTLKRVYGDDPFYFAFDAIRHGVARNLAKFGLADAPLDFISDRQVGEEALFKEGEAWAHANAKYNPPSLREVMANPPIFRDDKRFRPLQAADMHAWWQRRRYVEKLTGCERIEYPWIVRRQIPGGELTFTEQQIREHYSLLFRMKGSITSFRFGY
jgi:Protein of unknown function (DUF3800)